ncbi:kelch repeat-containing protein, partial [Polaribacter sp.]|nr:kelch repeat-containing protein [Polaribacter sp.]
MKGIIWLLFFLPFVSFSQKKTNGETNNLLVDSLRNQIIHITSDSLIRVDANNLKVLAIQKILRPKSLLSFTPIIKANKLIFVDNHGGDVFELTEKDSLAKIDNSDIKNFLIGSSIFIKNDTLIRYGGYGYWTISNFFIYLDNSTKQWEIYNISKTANKATAVYNHLSIDTGEEFYFFGGSGISHNAARYTFLNNEVWSFNFQTKNWHLLGKSKIDFLGLNPTSFIIDKSKYIINASGRLYRVDVIKNEFTEFKINPFLYLLKNQVNPVFYKDHLYYIDKKDAVKKIAFNKVSNKVLNTTAFYKEEKNYNSFLISVGFVFLCFLIIIIYEYLKLRNSLVISKNGLKYKSKFVPLDSVAISIIELVIIKEVEF